MWRGQTQGVLQHDLSCGVVGQVCAAHDAIAANPEEAKKYQAQYDYYPTQWVSPYIDRRRENGWSLYGLLGIGKGDKDKMHAQHQRNFKLFDAPVGLMFTIDPIMGRGSLAARLITPVAKVVNAARNNRRIPTGSRFGESR